MIKIGKNNILLFPEVPDLTTEPDNSLDVNLDDVCNALNSLTTLKGNIENDIKGLTTINTTVEGIDTAGFSDCIACMNGTADCPGFMGSIDKAIKTTRAVRDAILVANNIDPELFDQFQNGNGYFGDFLDTDVTVDSEGRVIDSKTGYVMGVLSPDALAGFTAEFGLNAGPVKVDSKAFFNFCQTSSSDSHSSGWNDQIWSSWYGSSAKHTVDNLAYMFYGGMDSGYLNPNDRSSGYGYAYQFQQYLQGKAEDAFGLLANSNTTAGRYFNNAMIAGRYYAQGFNQRAENFLSQPRIVNGMPVSYNPNYRFLGDSPYASGTVFYAGQNGTFNLLQAGGSGSISIGGTELYGGGEIDLLHATAGYGCRVTGSSVTVEASAEASLLHATGTAGADFGLVGVSGTATVDVGHVYANGKAGFGWDSDGGLEAGASFSAGADLVSASASGTVDVGGVKATGTVTAKVGIGVSAHVGIVDGVIQVNASAACGVGVGVGFSLDVSEAVDNVCEFASETWDGICDGAQAFGNWVSGIFG